ncbi:MAG TPA: hypothetical protein VFA80_18365 [Xanthobacteraceae bacterium]|nr:hypothetical protein [Xanthobacteraceae bacterium]
MIAIDESVLKFTLLVPRRANVALWHKGEVTHVRLAVANEGISGIDVWDRDVASDPNADAKERLTRFNLMQTGALFPK